MTKFEPREDLENPNVTEGSPLYDLALLLGGVAAVLVALFFVLSVSVDFLVPRVSVAWERKIFSHIPASAFSNFEPVTEGRLFDVYQSLVSHVDDDGTSARHWIQLGVECSEIPNAYALPGGHIVVTSGLLEKMKTDAGLRFVLGHELGHFFGRDHLRGLGKGLAFLSMLSVMGWGGLELSAVNAGFEAGQLAHIRDQERAADAYALKLITEKGFPLDGSEEFFELMLKDEKGWQAKVPLVMRTHPGSEERLQNLKTVIANPVRPIADMNEPGSLRSENPEGLEAWGLKLCAN